ncbi:hypothetical protein E2C01_055003 [Portunus trituberculatus]|uniref:Uncharacterized protein n=1 Tax=Portunus trituberculatus TaxID=210409 RepID=A0A5B7GQ31_PORTR|nr:hypothetical protein [Portunus trituberculatus]
MHANLNLPPTVDRITSTVIRLRSVCIPPRSHHATRRSLIMSVTQPPRLLTLQLSSSRKSAPPSVARLLSLLWRRMFLAPSRGC